VTEGTLMLEEDAERPPMETLNAPKP